MNTKPLYIALLSIICCCCVPKQKEVLNDDYRLAKIKSDFSNEDFIVYKNIPLGKNKAYVDSIIENDTACYPFNTVRYYTLRKAKQYENSDYNLYDLLGYGNLIYSMGINKTNHFYGDYLQMLKNAIKEAPEYLSLFIDYYAENLFKANIILKTENSTGVEEYSKLDGWFCYHSYQDTVFSVSCSFNKVLFNEKEDINNTINSLKETLNSKYGTPIKSEKALYHYLDSTSSYEEDEYLKWKNYSPKKKLRNLNIIDAFSWINGRYETQLLINKIYNSKSDYQEYELIVNYHYNKYIFEKMEILEKIKNEVIQKELEIEKMEEEKEQNLLKKKSLDQTL